MRGERSVQSACTDSRSLSSDTSLEGAIRTAGSQRTNGPLTMNTSAPAMGTRTAASRTIPRRRLTLLAGALVMSAFSTGLMRLDGRTRIHENGDLPSPHVHDSRSRRARSLPMTIFTTVAICHLLAQKPRQPGDGIITPCRKASHVIRVVDPDDSRIEHVVPGSPTPGTWRRLSGGTVGTSSLTRASR